MLTGAASCSWRFGGTPDSAATRAVRRLVVVTNWASALRQRMAPATSR